MVIATTTNFPKPSRWLFSLFWNMIVIITMVKIAVVMRKALLRSVSLSCTPSHQFGEGVGAPLSSTFEVGDLVGKSPSIAAKVVVVEMISATVASVVVISSVSSLIGVEDDDGLEVSSIRASVVVLSVEVEISSIISVEVVVVVVVKEDVVVASDVVVSPDFPPDFVQ